MKLILSFQNGNNKTACFSQAAQINIDFFRRISYTVYGSFGYRVVANTKSLEI